FSINQLRAQDNQDSPLSAGFKLGGNLSNYRLGGAMKNFNSKMNIGGNLGGIIKYDLSPNFALQSGIDVYYNTSKLESKTAGTSAKLKSLGVEVPLYAILQGEVGRGKAFIGAGAYAGYGITSKLDGVNLFKKNNNAGFTMNRFDYGLSGIIGFDFNKNWQINAQYKYGLADLHKGNGGSMKNQSASIGIAYKF
ncbi:MAG: porin family protein, partial [Sphingobacterium sp.]